MSEFSFEDFAKCKEYETVNREIAKRWIELMVEGGGTELGMFLDIATGTGLMTKLFLEGMPKTWRQPSVAFLDRSEEALRLVAKTLGREIQQFDLHHCNIEEAQFCKGSITVAVWGNGIHYLSGEAQEEALRRIMNSLRPGGWLFLNTAFYTEAIPKRTEIFYQSQMRTALTILHNKGIKRDKSRAGERVANYFSRAYYENLISQIGFCLVEVKEFPAQISQYGMECISSFLDYAAGVLRGYPPDESAKALVQAVGPAMATHGEKHGEKDVNGNLYIARNWLSVAARKP